MTNPIPAQGRDSRRGGGACRPAAAIGLALVLAAAGARGARGIEIDSIEATSSDDRHGIRVEGRAELPDGALVQGYLKFAHDPESQLDRQAAAVAEGRFALEFGPYAAPFFPTGYEVSVHFNPAEQPPGLLAGLDSPPGMAETARDLSLGRPDRTAALVESEVEALGRVAATVGALFGEANERADRLEAGPIDEAALGTWLQDFRARFARLREAYGEVRTRYAHPPFPRVDREIFVLLNFVIDQRYRIEAVLERQPPNPHPLGAETFARRLAAARRQLAFETVLVHPDPAAALESAWVRPLSSRLATWESAGPRNPASLGRDERVEAGLRFAHLVELAATRPTADPRVVNRWFLSLAEALDRIDEAAPSPRVRAALGGIARAGLEGRSPEALAEAVGEVVDGLGLTTLPADAYALDLETARALAADLFERTRAAVPEFDPEGWDIASTFWDAAVLRVQERLHASFPPLVARRLETPEGLAARKTRLARTMVRLLAEKERIAAALARGDDAGDLAAREAAFREEFDALEPAR